MPLRCRGVGRFSHLQDWRCVVFHTVCLMVCVCAFWLRTPRKPALPARGPTWSLFWLLSLAGSPESMSVSTSTTIPSGQSSRRSSSIAGSVDCGHFRAVGHRFFWEYCHVTIHHAKLRTTEDWTLPRQTASGSFENFQRYLFTPWPWRISMHLWKDLTARQSLRRRSLRELAIFLALWSIPFWIDPVMALWLWLLPHRIANAFVMNSGMYVQHALLGTDPTLSL
jgi:hypothetical protein